MNMAQTCGAVGNARCRTDLAFIIVIAGGAV